MNEENNENINNISNNFSNEDEINEEEMQPIPEISDDEDLELEINFNEEKKDNNKENNKNKEIKSKENISLKESLNEEEKIEFFPIDFLISNEEINSIDINIDSKNQINTDENNNSDVLKNNFFLTNLASKIKQSISRGNSLKEENIKNNNINNNKIENKSQEEEDEFEEIDKIEPISGLEEVENSKIQENTQKNSKKTETSKEEDLENNSFHSLSSSLNENIENKIGQIIDTDNKENSFMKQMLVETNIHYIKEQRQQSEKLQEWGLKVIINILMNSKNRIVQKCFYLIKYSRISLEKNRGKIIFKYYEKYREKRIKEFIKKYFIKFRIKAIELKPREERILDLIKGLNIDDKNIESFSKIEKLIKEKIDYYNKLKEEEKIKLINEEKTDNLVNKNEEKKELENKEEIENKEEKSKKLVNIDNNISESENKKNSLVPTPPPPPSILFSAQAIPPTSEIPLPPGIPIPPGIPLPSGVPIPPGVPLPPGVPPPPGVPLPPGVPPPPGFPLVNGFFSNDKNDPTNNIPKLPKGFISRKFQWQKINISNYQKSFWKQIEEEQKTVKFPLKIDFDYVQRIFTYEKITKNNQSKKENEKHKKKEETISILDSKRLMNMSISLSKIKIDKDKLYSLIITYDIDNILDLETLKSILSFFPSEEEKKALLNYKDDINKLSYPDQFCRMLVSIENCHKILQILLFKKQLSGKISNMLLQIRVLQEAVISINNSEQFKSILFILRQIGNYLNSGTSIGKAFGFSINSLSKLDSIKGINKEKTSLLELFIILIKKDNPGLINFYKDFKKLEESKNCFKDEIDKNVIELKNIVNKIIKEKENANNEDYIVFINNIENYSIAKIDCLQLSQKLLNDEIDKTRIIYGENESKFNINEFIKAISNFVDKYKTVSLEISKREARLLKRKISDEKKKKELNNVNNDLKKICDNTIKSIQKKTNLKNNIFELKTDRSTTSQNKEMFKINSQRGGKTSKINGIENNKVNIKKNKEDKDKGKKKKAKQPLTDRKYLNKNEKGK